MKKTLGMILSLMLVSQLLMAKNVNKSLIADTIKLIDVAGKQRMLSERIAKDYLYAGKHISTLKAKKELKKSFKELVEAQKLLVSSINNEDIKNLLTFVDMSIEDFKTTVNKKFNLDNAQLIIDLSESISEGSQYVVNSLEKTVNINKSKIIDISERQSMLGQRIAKYYIAYQSGIKDKNTVEQMNTAVKDFAKEHEAFMKNQSNTPAINAKLNNIDRLWKIVYKFYLNIEKGGLPIIVYNTTDNITNEMEAVTKLYVEIYK